jgi:hypothetical protein
MFTPLWLLGHRRYWWWHLLAIQKKITLSDHVLRYDESRTTSLRCQVDGKVSSPSDLRAAAGGFHGICDLHDPCDLPGQSC